MATDLPVIPPSGGDACQRLAHRTALVALPSEYGDFQMFAYGCGQPDATGGGDHLVVMKGDVRGKEGVLLRVHSECLTGDVFGSLRCDCGQQLASAMRRIAEEGEGVVVYLKQEGRGIGLHNKIRAYELQDQGHDTVEANEVLGFKPDLRDYGIGAQILLDLGLKKIRLLTNNPRKIVGLEGYNLEITGRVSLSMDSGEHNEAYLDTKRSKLGHLL